MRTDPTTLTTSPAAISTATIHLALDSRTMRDWPPAEIAAVLARATRRRPTRSGAILEVPAPVDRARLSAGALVLLDSGVSMLEDDDDLTPSLVQRRRYASLADAVEKIALTHPAAAEHARARAAALRGMHGAGGAAEKSAVRHPVGAGGVPSLAAFLQRMSGETFEAREELVEFQAPTARRADLADATDYLKRLAATPGLAVRVRNHWSGERIVQIHPDPLNVGCTVWHNVLHVPADWLR